MVPNFQSYDGGEHMFSYKRSKFAYVCTRPMFRCLGVGWLVGVVKGLGGGHFPRSPEGAGGQGVRGQGVRGSGVRCQGGELSYGISNKLCYETP